MMKKFEYLIIAAFTMFFATSCGNFLEEYSQDLTYARTASDIDEVLIGNGYMKIGTETVVSLGTSGLYFPWLNVMDDDIEMDFVTSIKSRECLTEFFSWGEYPYMYNNEVIKDDSWVRLYEHISCVNVLLSKIPKIEDSPVVLDRLKGECLFLRASFYYLLVNFYANPYSKESANKDLGVPIKTTEYIEDRYFSRNTVGAVYELILSDLNEAKRLLKGKDHKNIYRAGYDAVASFLSRVYLYMERYDEAIAAADEVLDKYTLLDFNSLTVPPKGKYVSTIYKSSPETIFSQGNNSAMYALQELHFRLSPDLIATFAGSDLRLVFGMGLNYAGTKYLYKKLADKKDGMVSSFFLLRTPEVLLNKAEALAMKGKHSEARALIEQLRIKRIKTDAYRAVTVEDGAATVNFIREERRRELYGEGHRWFDLRRYGVNSQYPYFKEIEHDLYAFDNAQKVVYAGSVKLGKYGTDPAWVLPIPKHVIEYNRGQMVDNAPREKRQIYVK